MSKDLAPHKLPDCTWSHMTWWFTLQHHRSTGFCSPAIKCLQWETEGSAGKYITQLNAASENICVFECFLTELWLKEKKMWSLRKNNIHHTLCFCLGTYSLSYISALQLVSLGIEKQRVVIGVSMVTFLKITVTQPVLCLSFNVFSKKLESWLK